MGRPSVLYVSHAAHVAPTTQVHRERGLLAAARLGEAHLHVSTLAPKDVLSVGAFHRRPRADGDVSLWTRHTGGRAVPAGRGFVVVSLSLPHRSALVDANRLTLSPEQGMNRAVRGVLRALRARGLDVSYPGLDLVTLDRRRIATLSFIEWGGPVLFQAIVAVAGSFAGGPFLLDRADPDGVVPADFVSPGEVTHATRVAGASIEADLAPAAFAGAVARGYADEFGLNTRDLDEDVTRVLADAHAADQEPFRAPDPAGRSARAAGLIGPVEAWATVEDECLSSFALTGDFLAPRDAPASLAAALRGRRPEPAEIAATLEAFLDRDDRYFLGIRPPDLADLIARAAA